MGDWTSVSGTPAIEASGEVGLDPLHRFVSTHGEKRTAAEVTAISGKRPTGRRSDPLRGVVPHAERRHRSGSGPVRSGGDRFQTTHWSLVLAARDRATPEAEAALADLCAAYWYPLYAFVRRKGHDPEHAADLTQEFFARLLEKDYLRSVDRSRGRFRSFLLAACTHFLANERDRARPASAAAAGPRSRSTCGTPRAATSPSRRTG